MYCTNCGGEIAPNVNYCTHCGCRHGDVPVRNGSHRVPIGIMVVLFLFGLFIYIASKFWGIELLGASTELAFYAPFIMQFA